MNILLVLSIFIIVAFVIKAAALQGSRRGALFNAFLSCGIFLLFVLAFIVSFCILMLK